MDYPNIKTGRDILIWFAEYFKEKNGYDPPSHFKKGAGFIRNMKNKGFTLEEIMLIVWGSCMTNDKVKSIYYCGYFIDKLDYYKKLKSEFEQKKQHKDPQYQNTFSDEKKTGDFFAELYD